MYQDQSYSGQYQQDVARTYPTGTDPGAAFHVAVAPATTNLAPIDIDVRPLHRAVERSGLSQGHERPESKKYVVQTHCKTDRINVEYAAIVCEDSG